MRAAPSGSGTAEQLKDSVVLVVAAVAVERTMVSLAAAGVWMLALKFCSLAAAAVVDFPAASAVQNVNPDLAAPISPPDRFQYSPVTRTAQRVVRQTQMGLRRMAQMVVLRFTTR